MAEVIFTEVKHYDTTGTITDITSDLINYKVEENWGESIESADLTFNVNVVSSVTFVEGNRITIKRGFVTATDEFVFDGMIIKTERFGGSIKLMCKDMLYESVKSEATVSYDIDIDPSAGVISEIFLDLINNYTSLTADATSVTSTSVAPGLDVTVNSSNTPSPLKFSILQSNCDAPKIVTLFINSVVSKTHLGTFITFVPTSKAVA